MLVLIATFLVIRKYGLVTANLPNSLAAHAVSIVGLKLHAVPANSFLVDAAQGQIERTSLWSYANYQLNLFTLLSGPIQRYQDFQEQWEKLSSVLEDEHAVRKAFLRLLIGIVKLAVVATIFLSLYQGQRKLNTGPWQYYSIGAKRGDPEHFLGILYFYPLYLYLNFSGYCDIVIAGGIAAGNENCQRILITLPLPQRDRLLDTLASNARILDSRLSVYAVVQRSGRALAQAGGFLGFSMLLRGFLRGRTLARADGEFCDLWIVAGHWRVGS